MAGPPATLELPGVWRVSHSLDRLVRSHRAFLTNFSSASKKLFSDSRKLGLLTNGSRISPATLGKPRARIAEACLAVRPGSSANAHRRRKQPLCERRRTVTASTSERSHKSDELGFRSPLDKLPHTRRATQSKVPSVCWQTQ